MAESLTRILTVLMTMTGWPLQAAALGSRAPFTPPQAMALAAPQATASGAAAGPLSAGAGASAETAPGLTGLRHGRHSQALIDGQWLRTGERARGALVLAIDTFRVVLSHPDGRREVLSLLPAASPTEVAAHPPEVIKKASAK